MAARELFVDTAGFLALWDAADEHHARALRLQTDLARSKRQFVRRIGHLFSLSFPSQNLQEGFSPFL